MNMEVMVVSGSSVRVSWDSVDLPEITGYIIHYSQVTDSMEAMIIEQSVTLFSTDTSFILENHLEADVEYQFELQAVAEINGIVYAGNRSVLTNTSFAIVQYSSAGNYNLEL